MSIITIIFWLFAAVALFSAVQVITSSNPVRAVLWLVLAFFNTSALWLIAHAEFLALTLVLVYVGAVMTLFLFVVMMMNIEDVEKRARFIKSIPVFLLGLIAAVVALYVALKPQWSLELATSSTAAMETLNTNNAAELGKILYTDYVYAFELAGVLLLVAIIAAISLAYRGPRAAKVQDIPKQLSVRPEDRLRILKMPAEKKE